LNTERNCTYGAVESDEPLLLPDGRLEQYLKLKDGRAFQPVSERWSYIPKTNLGLESRWTFPANTKTPTKESESLIVEFGKPPLIVIDPDSNCFYMKVESRHAKKSQRFPALSSRPDQRLIAGMKMLALHRTVTSPCAP
jgi:hypothetical protein